jgi:hypothetical protein
MLTPLIAIALQLSPQQEANEDQLKQWVKDHQSEIKQYMDRNDRVRALTYDQALIVYDQCLARAAASLKDVPPDNMFDRAHRMCIALRAELLNGRPPQWFIGFRDLDAAKRVSFPALTRQLRGQRAPQAAAPLPN